MTEKQDIHKEKQDIHKFLNLKKWVSLFVFIPVIGALAADFHPTAEHLIVFRLFSGVRIWEIQRGSEPEGR